MRPTRGKKAHNVPGLHPSLVFLIQFRKKVQRNLKSFIPTKSMSSTNKKMTKIK